MPVRPCPVKRRIVRRDEMNSFWVFVMRSVPFRREDVEGMRRTGVGVVEEVEEDVGVVGVDGGPLQLVQCSSKLTCT